MRAGAAPVIAAAVLVDLRRAAELGQEDHERLVEQAADRAGRRAAPRRRDRCRRGDTAAWPSRRCAGSSARARCGCPTGCRTPGRSRNRPSRSGAPASTSRRASRQRVPILVGRSARGPCRLSPRDRTRARTAGDEQHVEGAAVVVGDGVGSRLRQCRRPASSCSRRTAAAGEPARRRCPSAGCSALLGELFLGASSFTPAVKSSFFGLAAGAGTGRTARPSQPPTNRFFGGGPGRVVPGTAM